MRHHDPFVFWEIMRIPDTREAAVGCREGRSRTGKGRARACFLDGVWLRTSQHLKGRKAGAPRKTNWFNF